MSGVSFGAGAMPEPRLARAPEPGAVQGPQAVGAAEYRPAESSERVSEAPATAELSEDGGEELSADQQKQVQELKARDAEVRAHEAAHQAAGGGLTGQASFTFQTGPDGRQYAVGGEVSVDTGGGSSPGDTISKMQRVISAALAPASPSAPDQAVAAKARMSISSARQEQAELLRDEEAERVEAAAAVAETVGAPDGLVAGADVAEPEGLTEVGILGESDGPRSADDFGADERSASVQEASTPRRGVTEQAAPSERRVAQALAAYTSAPSEVQTSGVRFVA